MKLGASGAIGVFGVVALVVDLILIASGFDLAFQSVTFGDTVLGLLAPAFFATALAGFTVWSLEKKEGRL